MDRRPVRRGPRAAERAAGALWEAAARLGNRLEAFHRRLHEALGTAPPEYLHHGLIVGEDGKKLSKRSLLAPEPARLPPDARSTLERFRELCERNGSDAKALVRELKAVGGDLRAVRLALTARESGPELWAIVAALPRGETLRRIDAAL